jgi:hypothetical protein
MNQEFDSFVSLYGGRYRPTDLDQELYNAFRQRFLENAAEHELEAANGRTILTHTDIVASDDFNALAFVQNGCSYIGIFRGLVASLITLYELVRRGHGGGIRPGCRGRSIL